MTPRTRLLLGAWGPPAAWCAVIFAASSFPFRTATDLPRGSDKAAHLLEYGVLGLLAARALLLTGPGRTTRGVVLGAALLAAAWGGTDEFHQSFVPGRTPDWADLAVDALGGLAGAGLWTALRRRRAGGASATSPGSS